MQNSSAPFASFVYWFSLLKKILFAFGVNSSRHIKDNHLNQLCVGLSDSQLEYSTVAV